MQRLSALTISIEMRCVWWVRYEMGRGAVYLVRSVPACACSRLDYTYIREVYMKLTPGVWTHERASVR